VSEDFAFCKSRDWRMMVDGAGSHYPSEVAIARITYSDLLPFRAKRATEHRFTQSINCVELKLKTIHQRINSDGW